MTDRVLIGNKNVPSGPLFSEIPADSINFDIRVFNMILQENIPDSGTVSIRTAGTWYSYNYTSVSPGTLTEFTVALPATGTTVDHLYGDKVVVGSPTEGTGIWVSKPTANVLAMADANIPEDDWYGFQEEFDWVAEDGEWANSSPGLNRPYIPEGWVDGDPEASPFGFCTMALYGNAPGFANPVEWQVASDSRGKLKRTTNNTILYTGGYEKQRLFAPVFVSANASQSVGGYAYWWRPYSGDIHPDAIFPPDYPVIEMRIRRLSTPNYPEANPHHHDCKLSWSRNTLNAQDGATGANWPGTSGESYVAPNKIDSQPFNIDQPGYTDIFPHEEISGGTPGPWKILEWDLSNNPSWGGITDGQYRLHHMSFYLTTANSGLTGTGSTGAAWNPETDPMWEIDYVRVKQASIPAGLGRWNSKQASLLLDSDINHMGIVHQTGTVTIGTAKALINGNTSNRVVGHNIDNDANGYVSFPELPYIPLVLFQRIDKNVTTTGSSFPGGEDEFSICTQNWEDHRYPTIDTNTSENILYKGFDIQTVAKVKSSAYFKGPLDAPPMHENFYSFTSGAGDNKLTAAGGWYLQRYNDQIGEDFPLPWTGEIPDTSNRVGKKFSDMVQSFSEVRTFAYARAKKDGFWLTCRNAIAQEGLEPVLNLAPTLPEDATANQGSAAYTAMASNADNGAWGMFHPALALYDGNKFAEGLQLNWDSKVTANTFLLDKVGKDYNDVSYPQYKWWPSFSCSGLPFNGELALPNDLAPTDKTKYPLAYKTINVEGKNAGWTVNGMLANNTGGFYPYRYQSNEWYHDNDGSEHSTGIQYNIKRLSSAGIFHPHGVVPTTEEAFNNRNEPTGGTEIKNQTAYIGGAMNTKTGSVASYDKTRVHAPKYKYWVLRVPVSFPEYT